MADAYWYCTVSSNWHDAGNWWADLAHSIPLDRAPAAGDFIYLIAETSSALPASGPWSPLEIAGYDDSNASTADIFNLSNNFLLQDGGTLNVVSDGLHYHQWMGGMAESATLISAHFEGYVVNGGAVAVASGHSATFAGTSCCNTGTVYGHAVFSNGATNNGGTVGSATFNGTVNQGTVTGGAEFNAADEVQAANGGYGAVGGTATFHDASLNQTNGIVATAVFNDTSENQGTVAGDATFSDSSTNGYAGQGYVNGTATFNDSACNGPNGCVNQAECYGSGTHSGSISLANAWASCGFSDCMFSMIYVYGSATFSGLYCFGSVILMKSAATASIRNGATPDLSLDSAMLPGTRDVESGVSFDGGDQTGEFVVPPEAKVEKDYPYGYNHEFTGTLESEGGAYPAENTVLDGTPYGPNGNEYEGTRTDCPADKALTTASYGDPEDPINGEFNGATDWTTEEKAQIRYRLGIDGDVSAPAANQPHPDKAGYKLAADGLDAISTAAPSGVASTFREMLVQLWRRFFKKAVRDAGTQTIKTYADDGTTVLTTQPIGETSTTETQGAAL